MTEREKRTKQLSRVHSELRLGFREYFESVLAVLILKDPLIISVSQKISARIKDVLIAHEVFAFNSAVQAKIEEELYSEHMFGRLVRRENPIVDMIAALQNPNTPLQQIIHIHAIFIHRIYDHLPKSEEEDRLKKDMVEKLFMSSAFSSKNRGRIDGKQIQDAEKLTTAFGIAKNGFFSKKLMNAEPHRNSLKRFRPDEDSLFYQNMKSKEFPFVAGLSGHAGSLFLGAALYGDLTPVALHEYTLAIFAYVCASGNHSWHEVMSVAQIMGIAYQDDQYLGFLPESFLRSESYEKFTEILHSTTGEHHEIPTFRS